jgi:hypothetical protein
MRTWDNFLELIAALICSIALTVGLSWASSTKWEKCVAADGSFSFHYPVAARNFVRLEIIDVGSILLLSFPVPCLSYSFPSWAPSAPASKPGRPCSWRLLPYATR